MKRTALLSIAFFLSISVAKAETITVVGDPWCPYNCDPGSDKPGFMIEMAREIFKEKGIDVTYEVVPWSRAVNGARKGKYTAIVGAYKDDAPDFVFPKHVMVEAGDNFYMKKASNVSWKYKGAESLKKVSVGFIQDYSYGEDVDNYINQHKKDMAKVQLTSGDNALEKNVKKLLADRIQVIMEDGAVMQHYLNSTNQKNILRMVGKKTGEALYIAFSPTDKKSGQYAEILSEGIKRYEDTGKLRVIKARYGIK